MTHRRFFFVSYLIAFAVLLARDIILIFRFNEFEPKFGPLFNVSAAAIVDAFAGAAVAAILAAARAVLRKSRLTFVVLAFVAGVALVVFVNSESFKKWNARRAVQYVYWRNFAVGRKPLPDLRAFEHPRGQLLLHGFTQMRTDPWGRPYNYELIHDVVADHPHRKNWDINWAFWSNGPDGIDDGQTKKDDIDVTNSGL